MWSRWNDLPLRLRLTFLYVGLLVIILAALGSFLYLDTREFLISATASRLEALAGTTIGRHMPGGPPGPRTPSGTPSARNPVTSTVPSEPPFGLVARFLERDLTWQDTTAIVLDYKGAQISSGDTSSDPPDVPVPTPDALARAFAGQSVTYVTTLSGQETLAVLIPVHYPHRDSAIAGVIQMSTPLGVVEDVLQRQRLLIVGGVLLAIVLATAGGLWLTQTALVPLQHMVNVCRRIAGGDLSQRVNLPHHKDETGQLAEAFDDMVEQLDHAFVAQRQFVADASHELRTPLTAISGSLEVLLLAPEGDRETPRRVLHGMRREVQRLTRLVTDLLTLTRLDAQRSLNVREVDLARLAREVIESMRALAQERELSLETNGQVHCQGDADQLKQVFYNLLGNAINSTDATNGKIVLRVQQTDHVVSVSVSDNGIGIAEPALPHIFERFYRVDKARARASGGSGLGLAIVKGIVEAHGGTVGPVESKVGVGTTIRLTLPGEA